MSMVRPAGILCRTCGGVLDFARTPLEFHPASAGFRSGGGAPADSDSTWGRNR